MQRTRGLHMLRKAPLHGLSSERTLTTRPHITRSAYNVSQLALLNQLLLRTHPLYVYSLFQLYVYRLHCLFFFSSSAADVPFVEARVHFRPNVLFEMPSRFRYVISNGCAFYLETFAVRTGHRTTVP